MPISFAPLPTSCNVTLELFPFKHFSVLKFGPFGSCFFEWIHPFLYVGDIIRQPAECVCLAATRSNWNCQSATVKGYYANWLVSSASVSDYCLWWLSLCSSSPITAPTALSRVHLSAPNYPTHLFLLMMPFHGA